MSPTCCNAAPLLQAYGGDGGGRVIPASMLCAQAREAALHQQVLGSAGVCLGQAAAGVAVAYGHVLGRAGLPYCWAVVAQVKERHYLALGDYYVARALLGGQALGQVYHTELEIDKLQHLGEYTG